MHLNPSLLILQTKVLIHRLDSADVIPNFIRSIKHQMLQVFLCLQSLLVRFVLLSSETTVLALLREDVDACFHGEDLLLMALSSHVTVAISLLHNLVGILIILILLLLENVLGYVASLLCTRLPPIFDDQW